MGPKRWEEEKNFFSITYCHHWKAIFMYYIAENCIKVYLVTKFLLLEKIVKKTTVWQKGDVQFWLFWKGKILRFFFIYISEVYVNEINTLKLSTFLDHKVSKIL